MISSTFTAIGSIPFLKQLFAKISANDGAIITRNPNSPSAHGGFAELETFVNLAILPWFYV